MAYAIIISTTLEPTISWLRPIGKNPNVFNDQQQE